MAKYKLLLLSLILFSIYIVYRFLVYDKLDRLVIFTISKNQIANKINETPKNIELKFQKLRSIVKNIAHGNNNKVFCNKESLYTHSTRGCQHNLATLVLERNLTTILQHQGKLNIYIWNDYCSQYINPLRSSEGFPFNPAQKSYTSKLHSSNALSHYGQRIFGYLNPPLTGYYKFSIESTYESELWLSFTDNPGDSINLASYNPQNKDDIKYSEKLSTIFLIGGKFYYIEVLNVGHSGNDFLEVKWLHLYKREYANTKNKKFKHIPSQYFYPYTIEPINKIIPETFRPKFIWPQHISPIFTHREHYIYDVRDYMYKYPKLSDDIINTAIPWYNYTPKYALDRNEDIFTLQDLKVYPEDQTDIINTYEISHGNKKLPKHEAEEISELVLTNIKNIDGDITLDRIVNIEKLSDNLKQRYFVDLLVYYINDYDRRYYRISKYFVKEGSGSQTKIFQPTKNKIRDNTFIYFLIVVKQMGMWLRACIENLERIYTDTGDTNFGLVVVDFESSDIDAETLLRQSLISNWTLITVEGKFMRAGGINIGLDVIENPNHIVFVCDLTLQIPSNILYTIRTHTFQGYAGFIPTICRIMCGYTVNFPLGYWEERGYGLMAMYKSDWSYMNGMDSESHLYKYGGEDWDFGRRLLKKGYLLERIKVRQFYHHYHSRIGLWGTSHKVVRLDN